MNTPKQSLAELVPKLPDDVSYDDVMYLLYVRKCEEEGIEPTRAGYEEMLFRFQFGSARSFPKC